MPNINDPGFYVNFVNMTRDEAAFALATLLLTSTYSDEELQQMGAAVGLQGDIRKLLNGLGKKIDVNWDKMLEKTITNWEAQRQNNP